METKDSLESCDPVADEVTLKGAGEVHVQAHDSVSAVSPWIMLHDVKDHVDMLAGRLQPCVSA